MPDWYITEGGGKIETAGANTSNSGATTVTTASSVNTKGSYVQLIASTSFDTIGFWLRVGRGNIWGLNILVDIAVGPASSEQIILSNFPSNVQDNSPSGFNSVFIPISIPTGTRISARCQANKVTYSVELEIILVSGSATRTSLLSRATTYGANTGDSGGTQIDPGGTANTLGAYSQIIASTTNDIKALAIIWHWQTNTALSKADFLFSLAIGASGSEKIIIPDIWLYTASTRDVVYGTCFGPIAYTIPAGTRLAMAAQSSITNSTDRLSDVVIIGFD